MRLCNMAAVVFAMWTHAATASEGDLLWSRSTGTHLPLAVTTHVTDETTLYVALKTGGVSVWRKRDQGSPDVIANLPKAALGGLDAMNLHRAGKWLYVALGDHFAAGGAHAGLAIVDMANARRPRVVSVWKTVEKGNGAADVAIDGGFAFLAAMRGGIHVIDIRNAARPALVASLQPDVHFPKRDPGRIAHPNARGVAVHGDRLYIAYDAGGLRVIDIRNRRAPREIGRYINPRMGGKAQAYNNVVIVGRNAYVAVDYCGMEIIDIANPAAMTQVGWWNPWHCERFGNLWFNSGGHTNQIEVDRAARRAYLSAGDSELVVVDVSDKKSPTTVHTIGNLKDGLGAWGMHITARQKLVTYIRTPIPFKGTWSGIKAYRSK